MFCTSCGKPIPDGADTCPSCGAKLMLDQMKPGQAPTAPQGQQPQAPTAPQGMPQQPQAPVQPTGAMPQAQAAPQQPQFNQAPQGMPQQPQFNQVPQGMPQQPQGQPRGAMPGAMQPNFPQQGMPMNGQPTGAMPGAPMGQPMKAPKPPKAPMDPAKKKKIIIGSIIGGVVLIAAIVLLLYFLVWKKTSIDVSKYYKITVEGYEGNGKAKVEFDSVKFKKDYKGKIKLDGESKKYLGSLVSDPTRALSSMFDDYALGADYNGDLDKYEELKNGDTVTFELSKSDINELERYFKIKITKSKVTLTVSGLSEVETFDPFENIEITYRGTDGSAKARISYTGDDWSSPAAAFESYLEATPNENLKNGDTITVSVVDYYNEESFIENYGAKPSETSKEFTVEGLESYAKNVGEVTPSVLTKVKEVADKENQEKVENATKYYDEITCDASTNIGTVFYYAKDQQYTSRHNFIAFVYRNDYSVTTKDGSVKKISVYEYYAFKNMPSGDATDFEVPDRSNYYSFSRTELDGYKKAYGTATLDELKKDMSDYFSSSDYDVEDKIDESKAPIATSTDAKKEDASTEEGASEETTTEE